MKCDECRFSIRNNGEKMTCNFYRREYNFSSDMCHDFQYFQPILKPGMKVQHKINKDLIYTIKMHMYSDVWSFFRRPKIFFTHK